MKNKEHNDKNEQVSENLEKTKAHEELETGDDSEKKNLCYVEQIVQLEIELNRLQSSMRDVQLRAKAEIENMHRRVEIDIEKAHKFALERFVNELLPVIDSLERALEVADKKNLQSLSMIEGIELTLKSMLCALQKFGINVIEETNIPFNPELHQAMSVMQTDELEENSIMKIMQKGYTLHGRLLRPAMVIVSKVKNA